MENIKDILEKRFGSGEHGWSRRKGVWNDDGAKYYPRNGSFGMCEDEVKALEDAEKMCIARGEPHNHPADIDPLDLWRLRKINTPDDEIADYFGYTMTEFKFMLESYPLLRYLLSKGRVAFKTMIREGQYQLGRNLNENMLIKFGEAELNQKYSKGNNVNINVGSLQGMEDEFRKRVADLRYSAAKAVSARNVQDGQVLLNGGSSESDVVVERGDGTKT